MPFRVDKNGYGRGIHKKGLTKEGNAIRNPEQAVDKTKETNRGLEHPSHFIDHNFEMSPRYQVFTDTNKEVDLAPPVPPKTDKAKPLDAKPLDSKPLEVPPLPISKNTRHVKTSPTQKNPDTVAPDYDELPKGPPRSTNSKKS